MEDNRLDGYLALGFTAAGKSAADGLLATYSVGLLMNTNSSGDLNRRRFLLAGLRGAGGVWASLHWPAVFAAAEHAMHMREAVPPAELEILSADQAAEIEAVASRIIPSDKTQGAREAGVVYFIDRALATFAADSRDGYEEGLPGLQAKARELFPSVPKFSHATPEQQDAVLRALEGTPVFELIRMHTIMGFLSVPERGGNRGEVGWKLIRYDASPVFAPPFGYYDRDYPGWHPPDGNK
jgi:gluconate 2-dehydrogenase gamma chain